MLQIVTETQKLQIVAAACAFAVAAALSAAGTWTARRMALARGFVDRPGGHKGHAQPVALGGGVAVLLAFGLPVLLGLLLAHWLAAGAPGTPSQVSRWVEPIQPHLGGILAKTPTALAILAASTVLCLVGLFDDARPLRASIKFIIQLAVAAALVVGFKNFRLMWDLGETPSLFLSILWILTLTNSLNFLDNMDGLASGVAMIAAAVFALTAMRSGQIFVPTCCWLLVGALAGFLPFNFHPATIYLGDAGSLVLGLLLSLFTILTTFADPHAGEVRAGVLAPLVIMAVPLYDTASVFFLRWRIGVPIWAGDRRHFSHRLVRRGMGVRRAVMFIWLATLTTGLPALMLPTAGSWIIAAGIVLQTLLVILLVALMESAGENFGAPGEHGAPGGAALGRAGALHGHPDAHRATGRDHDTRDE